MDRRFTPIAASLFATITSPMLLQDAHAQTPSDTTMPEIKVTESVASPIKAEKATSEKFTAPLLDTPKTVSVISQDLMSQTSSTTLVDALRLTPGITFGAGEGGNPVGDRPFIRGFDAQASTFIDGVRDLGSQSRETFNIESIEVVKGASSAFGGGGSTGGSINLVSKAPLKEELRAGSIALGNAGYKRVSADGNFLIGDNAAFRLNAMVHDAGIPGRDAVDNTRWGIAPSLTLGLNSATRMTFSYYHMQSDDLPDSGIPYNNPKAGDARNGDGAPYGVNRNTFYGLADRDFRKTQADIGTARIEHDITPLIHVRNTTRIGKTDNDYLWTQPDDSQGNTYNGLVWRRANSRYTESKTIQNQTALYGETMTGTVKHNFSTGIELSREETMYDAYLAATSTGTTACLNGSGAVSNYNCTSLTNPNSGDPWSGYVGRANKPTNAANNTYSAYVFDTATLSPQWSVNGGVRFDSYRTSLNQGAYPAVTAANSPTGVAIAAVSASNLRNNSSFFNYQSGVVFKPLSNGSIYVNYSTSSDPAGLNASSGTSDGALTATNQTLDPERSKSIELGSKWDLFNNKLSLTGALFRTEKTNARVTDAAGVLQLAGNYKVQGFELGFSGNITSKWQVYGGYTRLNSEIVDAGQTNVGTTAAPVYVPSTTNGNQFANIPKDSYSLWTSYAVLPKATVGAGAFYQSKVYGNTANTKFIPAYTRIDAMASYAISKTVTMQLNIQNLANNTYFNQAYASHYASVAPGRSIILAMNVRY